MAHARANHPETKFDKICRLARELDEVGLGELAGQDAVFHRATNESGDTPLRLLAREGCDAAVWLLLTFSHFADDAVLGYAEAGQIEKVNSLGERKTMADFVTYAEYAAYLEAAPYVSNLNRISIAGYAYAGLHDQVENIVSENEELGDYALRGYLRAESWHKIKEFVDRGYQIDTKDLSRDFLLNRQKVSKLIALVNSDQQRREILRLSFEAEHPWGEPDKARRKADAELLHRAGLLNRVMREFQLTYEQADAWERMREQTKYVESVRIWLLQGIQVADGNNTKEPLAVLPILLKDIYLHITTFVLGMSLDDTKAVLKGVHANLFGDVMKNVAMRFADKKIPTTLFAEAAKATQQYEKRIAKYNF